MPEWMKSALDHGSHLPQTEVIVMRVGLAMLFGFVVAAIYRLTSLGRDDATKSLPTTLALLTVLISLVTVVIGDNIARAFGLVGALSIVRFRSVVKDTRDTAFVIFAVIVGMAIGAGYLILAAIAVPAVTLTALAMARAEGATSQSGRVRKLSLRLPSTVDVEATLHPVLDRHVGRRSLKEISTGQQGATIELTYLVRLKGSHAGLGLIADLQRIAGVDNIKLRAS